VGYDSPQAFTRAFSQFTGQSPRAFQRDMHRLILDPGAANAHAKAEQTLAVQIVERPAQRLHALRHQGPPSTIPHTQRRLYLQCGQRAAHRLGASCGDPQEVEGGGFRYYAAVVLPEPLSVADGGLERLDIPAGLYARHTLTGPYTRINAALAAIHTRWLPASGYEPDDRPTLEHYLNSPRNAAQADLRTDLLIPIRPTTSL